MILLLLVSFVYPHTEYTRNKERKWCLRYGCDCKKYGREIRKTRCVQEGNDLSERGLYKRKIYIV